MKIFASLQDLSSSVGQDVAVSDWVVVTQEQINLFAQATGDHQWIHTDADKAQSGPFGTTIAHGFLTLSLLPKFIEEVIDLPFGTMSINYGLNKVRFPAPMLVGGRLRGRFSLLSLERIEGGVQTVWQVTMEREGNAKPACVAESVLRRYF